MSELGSVTAVLRADISDFAAKMTTAGASLKSLSEAAAAANTGLKPLKASTTSAATGMNALSTASKATARNLGTVGTAAARTNAQLAASGAGASAAASGLTKTTKASRDSEDQLRKAGREADTFGAKWNKNSNRVASAGRAMTMGITLPVGVASAMSLKLAGDFDSSMAQVQVALGGASVDMSSFKDLAMRLGKDTQYSALEVSNSMMNLAKGGMSEAQIKSGALAASLSLAAAGGLELEDASNVMIASMSTFGLQGEQAGSVADALAGAANKSAADVTDLGEAIRYTGNLSATAGYSLQDTTAVLAALGDQGQRGSVAGTSMRAMFSAMLSPTDAAKSKMKELGLTFVDSSGKIKDAATLAGDLEKAFSNMGDAERAAAMETIFGIRGLAAADAMRAKGAAGMREYVAATMKVGNAQEMANAKMTGWTGTWERFKGSLETAGISLGKAIIPTMTTIVDKIGEMSDAFTELPPSMQTVIGLGALFAAALGPLMWLGGKIATLGPLLMSAGGAFASFGTAAMGALTGTAGAAAGITSASGGLLAFAAAAAAAGTAMSVWSGSMFDVNAGFQGWQSSIAAFTAGINPIISGMAAMKQVMGESANMTSFLDQKINNTSMSVRDMDSAMSGATDNLEGVTRSMTEMAGKDIMNTVNQFQQFPDATRKALAANEGFSKSLRSAGLIADTTTGQIRELTESEKTMANGFTGGGGGIGAAGVNMQRLGQIVQGLDPKMRTVAATSRAMQAAMLGVGQNATRGGAAVQGYAAQVARMGVQSGASAQQVKATLKALGTKKNDIKIAMKVVNLEQTKASLSQVESKIASTKSKIKTLSQGKQTVKVQADTAAAQGKLKSLEAEKRRLTASKAKLEVETGSAKGAIAGLGASLGAMSKPPPIVVDVQTSAAEGNVNSLKGNINSVQGKSVTVEVVTVERTEKRAKGGPVGRSMPYLVGEEGPELFFPGQSARSAARMGTGKYDNSDKYPTLLGVGGPTMFFPREDGEVIPADKTKQLLADGMPIAGALAKGGKVKARGPKKPKPFRSPIFEVDQAYAESRYDRWATAQSTALNRQGLTKKQIKAGKSTGRGDEWRAGEERIKQMREEAKSALDEIRSMQRDLAEEMAQIREGLTSNLLSQIQSDSQAGSSGGMGDAGIGGKGYMSSGVGGAASTGGGGGFAGGISNFLSQIRTFYANLKELATKGLPLGLLGQLIQMGVVQGGAAAQELLSADIPSIATEWSEIVAISNSISTDASLVGGSGSKGGLMSGSYANLAQKQATYNAMPYKAIGGSVMEGMPYVVGEKGPELFRPKTSGEIIPAGRTRNMLRSGSWRGATATGGAPEGAQIPQGFSALPASGGGMIDNDRPTHVHLHIDGSKVHSSVVKASKRYALRNSSTQLTPTFRG